MRFLSIRAFVVIVCATFIVASELGRAMLLLPIIIRRAAARRHLSEKLLNEINEIDFPKLTSQPIRRRSTTTGEDHSHSEQRPDQDLAANVRQVDSSVPERPQAAMGNETAMGKSDNFVAQQPKILPKVDIFGDADWPPRPRRQRNCEARMMAGLSGMRILGKLAKCLDGAGDGGGDKDDRQPDTSWKLEGSIAEHGDFYLKKKPEAQRFNAKFEKMVDEWLVVRDKARAAAAAAGAARTG